MTDQQGTTSFGRVDDNGTVFVRTADGEREVGQWPDGDPAAALAFYQKRFDGLAVEVDLLEQRIRAGALSPEDAASRIAAVRTTVQEAQAVGDIDALLARLDDLPPLVEQRRAARKEERAAKVAESRQAKERIVAEAEQISSSDDWKAGANRLRDLLDEWKALPRIDKSSDDQLWHRFSAARTSYTRRRKQHFADLNERRDAARDVKQRLVEEAEALSGSTEWGETAHTYRDMMARWKAAGSARRNVDDALWKRFRAAQDAFFGARDAANAEIDKQYEANAKVKRALIGEAEQLLPVDDFKAARESFRGLAQRWDTAGKVPRGEMKELEGRFKKVEQAVRGAEDDRWRRSNPEGYARASDTVTQLESSLDSLRADLAKAEAAGNERAAAKARDDIVARQSWLDEARKAVSEFGS
ncbi:MAG: DUF349 domain-containing protein, partial [Nocardioidaceae bacterium]